MASGILHYNNRTLGKTEPVTVILPEADLGPGSFPVIYLLHGIGDDHTDWLRRTRLEEYVKALPVIVVMPTTNWQSMYVDAVDGAQAATAIAIDLVDFIDTRLNTRPEMAYRAVCGLSMGGYGAIHLAFSHSERFAAAASHSGVLLFCHLNADECPSDDNDSLLRNLTLRHLGPTPKGGPQDLFALAQQLPLAKRPALRFDCGDQDFLLEHNRVFHRHLESLAYPHEYEEHPGGHTWDYWDAHVMDSIHFFTRQLGWGESVL